MASLRKHRGHLIETPAALALRCSTPLQVLDTTSTVAPDYHQLQEVAVFLTQPNPLPPDMGLGAQPAWGG